MRYLLLFLMMSCQEPPQEFVDYELSRPESMDRVYGGMVDTPRDWEYLKHVYYARGGYRYDPVIQQQAVLAKKARGMKITKLTKRERQIWELFSSGVKRTTIADMLFISRRTVDVHIQNIYKKKGINSQIEAIATKYDKV